MMEKRLPREWIAIPVTAAVLSALALLTAGLLIRHLSCFMNTIPQFQEIFAQLKDAKLGVPVWLLLPQLGLCMLSWRLWRREKRLGGWCVLLFGWLLILICALYCTRVNGILFGDVVRSLLQVLMKGGLEL